MRFRRIVAGAVIMVSAVVMACSGLPKSGSGGGGGGGGGNGNLPISMTMSAVPSGVPTTISILSFTVRLSGITITSQTTGKVTNLNLTNFTIDLNKLLADSAFLGKFTVSSDSFSKIQIAIASSQVVYCTSTSGVAGCTSGSIATTTGGAATLTFSYSPALNPSTTGIGVRFRIFMSRALILNTAGTAVTSVDFTQPLVGFSEQLPLAANLTSPQLDYVDDVAGLMTSVGTSTVTNQSAAAGTITANVTSTSNFSAQNCTSNTISCAQTNQVAAMDMILNADSSFSLLLFDPFDTKSNDWVEGVISALPSSSTQFSIVVTNFVPAATGSLIGSKVHLGDQVSVTIAGGTVFSVDLKNLQVPSNSFSGGQDTSVLFPGQVVAVRATSFTAASGTTPASVTVNALILRFSRLAGLPGGTGTNFTFTPTAPMFGITGTAQTFETLNVTNYDLGTSGTSLTAAQAAGISALYLGPPSAPTFVVAKVRQ